MQVSRIKISNILGIESLEFDAGQFVAFTGTNGTGKTSALEAIKAALSGGHDATLLRNGEKEGEVVLVLDDGSTIQKRVREGGSETVMRDAKGLKVSSPATKVRSLVDALSVNPVEFLTAKADKRVSVLLESMPLKADAAKLQAITGVKVAENGAHALDVIQAVRKQVYDDRTATNGAAKAKRATIQQLSAAIPDSLGDADDGDEDSLNKVIEDANAALQDRLDKIKAKINRIRTETQAEIDALMEQVAAKRLHLSEQESKARIAENDAAFTASKAKSDAQAKLDALKRNRENIYRAKNARDNIAVLEADAADLEADSERMTKAIAELDAYKADLLSDLPIQGLEVANGEVLYKGVAFDRVNTAQKVKIAVELAKLRAGKLGLVCVDGIEALDPATYEAFKAEALKSGVQMVVTRVSDGEFSVEVD